MDDIGLLFKAVMGMIGTITAAVIGLFYRTRKEHREIIDSHSKKLVVLENKIVTEDRVREVMKDELNNKMEPVLDTLGEIKELCRQNTNHINTMSADLAEQKGYRQAVKDLQTKAG